MAVAGATVVTLGNQVACSARRAKFGNRAASMRPCVVEFELRVVSRARPAQRLRDLVVHEQGEGRDRW